MKHKFEQCIKKGQIIKIDIDQDLISKELKEAEYDLNACEKSLTEGNFKWAIIQGYYSMFHSFRALLFSKGFREKSHTCLKHAIESLFIDTWLLDKSLLQDFKYAMTIREGADYGHTYSEDSARELTDSAKRIYDITRTLL